MNRLSYLALITMVGFPINACAEYTCGGTFLKANDPYPKGYRCEVQDYFIRNGQKYYGVFRAGQFPAKDIRLDKDCNIRKLKHDVETEKFENEHPEPNR